MDTTQINHNNSGQKYRIAVDIAKEGSHIWDLTPYFKGRVGDNNFGLQVTWYYQGQLMNVVGMKPYIEGLVGQYSFDKNGEIDMDPNAVPVRYDGSPDDCEEGGKVTFYFPSQMFPQEGIFKGFIGVKDDRDDSNNPQISGVTIWFKVLPGIAQMGHACDAYVDELDKALQDFKEKLDEHDKNYQSQLQNVIDDARNTYESETKNAHDAVLAAKAEADATKANQDNLNQLINDTIQYIQSHNIVTLDKYNALASQIVNRLGQMNFKPTWYPNEADMRSANPNGTQDVCITADTGHKWIYFNSQWMDLGTFAFADIDPKLKESFLSNSDNIIPNPDFEDDALSWSFVNATGNANGAIIVSPDMSCKRVANLNASANETISFQSDLVHVDGQTNFSFKALTRYDHQPDSTGTAAIGFDVFDANNKQIDHVVQAVMAGVGYTSIDNYQLSDLAAGVKFWAYLAGEGILRIGCPHATFTAKTGAYTVQEAQASQPNPDNVLPNSDLKNGTGWSFVNITGKANGSIISDTWAGNANVISLNAANSETISAQTDAIPINGHDVLSIGAMANYNHLDTSTGWGVIGVDFYDATGKQIAHIPSGNIPKGIGKVSQNNIVVPSTAALYRFWVYLAGEGNLKIAKPQVTYNAKLGAYSVQEVEASNSNEDNPLPNLKNGTGWSFINATGNANGSIISDTWAGNANVINLNAANSETISVQSDLIPINGHDVLSIGALANYNHLDTSTGWGVIGVDFYDATGKQIAHIPSGNIPKGISKVSQNNIVVPSTAAFYRFWIYFAGEGNLKIAKPQVTYATVLGHSDLSEVGLNFNPENALPNSDFKTQDNWIFMMRSGNVSGYIDNNDSINASNVAVLSSADKNGTISFQTTSIQPIGNHLIYSVGALTKSTIEQGSKAAWGLNFFDANGNPLSDKMSIQIVPSNDYLSSSQENMKFPDQAKYYQVWVWISGQVDLKFARPHLNFDEKLKPYLGEEQEKQPPIPVMQINVPQEIGDKWENGSFAFVRGNDRLEGYIQIGIQGNSSRMFNKKNFKIKLYQDADCKNKLKICPKSDWDKNFKFNLKANWIDFTQSRNLMSAKLVADAERATPIEDENIEQKLGKSQNMGQMEGFPIELYINDDYHGMYTWNTKKDDKTFGMDSDDKTQEVISVGKNAPDHMFFTDTGSVIDGKMWGTEIHDTIDPTIQVNFAQFINWINQSSDNDFVQNLHTYIDVYSVINTMLFGIYSNEYDYYCKSLLLATYDSGKSYYMLPYDLDSTWGDEFQGLVKNHSIYDGAFDVRHLDQANFVNNNTTNLLFKRVLQLMLPEVKQQWQYLRSTVWTIEKVCRAYKDYIKSVPEIEYDKDLQRWPNNPSAPDTSYSQIQAFILGRTRLMDNWLGKAGDNITNQLSILQNQINQLKNDGTTQK